MKVKPLLEAIVTTSMAKAVLDVQSEILDKYHELDLETRIVNENPSALSGLTKYSLHVNSAGAKPLIRCKILFIKPGSSPTYTIATPLNTLSISRQGFNTTEALKTFNVNDLLFKSFWQDIESQFGTSPIKQRDVAGAEPIHRVVLFPPFKAERSMVSNQRVIDNVFLKIMPDAILEVSIVDINSDIHTSSVKTVNEASKKIFEFYTTATEMA